MTIAADTHIILDIHTPKKDARVGQGAPTVGVNDVAIWGNTLTQPEFTTQTIASFRALHDAMFPDIEQGGAGVLIASGPIDASASEVTAIAPVAGQVGVYIGADVHAKAQTHFVDRTLKRLRERWLELAKTGSGVAPVGAATITSAGNNHVFSGTWDGGDRISVVLKLTDPDGLEEADSWVVQLPGVPGGVTYDAVAVATMVCTEIDALVHIRCGQTGSRLSLTPAAPANTLESTLTVL